jgi:hypothetical protein
MVAPRGGSRGALSMGSIMRISVAKDEIGKDLQSQSAIGPASS